MKIYYNFYPQAKGGINIQKDVSIQIEKDQVESGENLNGVVRINYTGRFDSLVINSQIENSSDVFKYVNLDGKKLIILMPGYHC
jgi:hypothetical protein